MAANADTSPRRDLYSVSGEEEAQPMNLGERSNRRTMDSLDRTRQSSEFQPKDSTIHYIWQVSCRKLH